MPAVDRIRLQTQIRLVKQTFASADEFTKKLSDLYEFYSDRSFEAATPGQLRPITESYNITPLVSRQFEFEFSQLCVENPLSSLDVIDRLWQVKKLEPRKLAAYMLGKCRWNTRPVIERLQNGPAPPKIASLSNTFTTPGQRNCAEGHRNLAKANCLMARKPAFPGADIWVAKPASFDRG
jgi:hypothetical protein